MNLQEETRNGYMISAQMKKVWAVQIKLLEKLLEVCDKHQLKIWADGGTLLGTIRHKGYIPWDDDIDMVMLRPDYDKLISIATTEFSSPFVFQCGYSDSLYPRGHAQLRMDGTTAILLNDILSRASYHLGIFIDIFPYDAVPDNEAEMNRQIEERASLLNVLQKTAKGFDLLHPLYFFRFFRKKLLFKQLFSDYESIFRRFKIEDCKNVSCFSFIVDPKHFLRDKHWYDETVFLPFEGVLMPVPKEFDKILTLQYGNYMRPVQSPSFHGGFWALDADHSWQETMRIRRKEIHILRKKRFFSRIKKVLRSSK